MADDNPGGDRSPEDEFQELMRRLMSGDVSGIDPEQLSRLSGMQIDPAMLQAVMAQLQGAFAGTNEASTGAWPSARPCTSPTRTAWA